jgi:hypothetical protein
MKTHRLSDFKNILFLLKIILIVLAGQRLHTNTMAGRRQIFDIPFGESKRSRIFNVTFTNPDGIQQLEKYKFQFDNELGQYGTTTFPPGYFEEIPEQYVVVPPALQLKDGGTYRLTGPNAEERFVIEREIVKTPNATSSGKKH